MNRSGKIPLVVLAGLLLGSVADAATSVECNEKIRLQVVSGAKAKCGGKYRDLVWSEKELDASESGKAMTGVFSFQCPGGKRYLGLVKSSFPPACEISKTEISHASSVPARPVAD